jgi:hypothetical protein
MKPLYSWLIKPRVKNNVNRNRVCRAKHYLERNIDLTLKMIFL